jgi:hypothetical protein
LLGSAADVQDHKANASSSKIRRHCLSHATLPDTVTRTLMQNNNSLRKRDVTVLFAYIWYSNICGSSVSAGSTLNRMKVTSSSATSGKSPDGGNRALYTLQTLQRTVQIGTMSKTIKQMRKRSLRRHNNRNYTNRSKQINNKQRTNANAGIIVIGCAARRVCQSNAKRQLSNVHINREHHSGTHIHTRECTQLTSHRRLHTNDFTQVAAHT